jgi:hypothetical protein
MCSSLFFLAAKFLGFVCVLSSQLAQALLFSL